MTGWKVRSRQSKHVELYSYPSVNCSQHILHYSVSGSPILNTSLPRGTVAPKWRLLCPVGAEAAAGVSSASKCSLTPCNAATTPMGLLGSAPLPGCPFWELVRIWWHSPPAAPQQCPPNAEGQSQWALSEWRGGGGNDNWAGVPCKAAKGRNCMLHQVGKPVEGAFLPPPPCPSSRRHDVTAF